MGLVLLVKIKEIILFKRITIILTLQYSLHQLHNLSSLKRLFKSTHRHHQPNIRLLHHRHHNYIFPLLQYPQKLQNGESQSSKTWVLIVIYLSTAKFHQILVIFTRCALLMKDAEPAQLFKLGFYMRCSSQNIV